MYSCNIEKAKLIADIFREEAFNIKAPDTNQSASDMPPSQATISLDDPQFFAYAGIPIASSGVRIEVSDDPASISGIEGQASLITASNVFVHVADDKTQALMRSRHNPLQLFQGGDL